MSVVQSTAVAAIRIEMYYSYGNSNPCIGEWPLYGGVRYLECPLREVPLTGHKYTSLFILGESMPNKMTSM